MFLFVLFMCVGILLLRCSELLNCRLFSFAGEAASATAPSARYRPVRIVNFGLDHSGRATAKLLQTVLATRPCWHRCQAHSWVVSRPKLLQQCDFRRRVLEIRKAPLFFLIGDWGAQPALDLSLHCPVRRTAFCLRTRSKHDSDFGEVLLALAVMARFAGRPAMQPMSGWPH